MDTDARRKAIMFCDQILGNLDSEDAGDAPIDWLDLTWRDCARRALRKQTRSGVEVKLLLPISQTPRHRDILARDIGSLIAVNVLCTKVLVAKPPDLAKMGLLALELGNLHAPVEIISNKLITIPDGPVEAVLMRMEIPYETEIRRFTPEHCSIASLPQIAKDLVISNVSG